MAKEHPECQVIRTMPHIYLSSHTITGTTAINCMLHKFHVLLTFFNFKMTRYNSKIQ